MAAKRTDYLYGLYEVDEGKEWERKDEGSIARMKDGWKRDNDGEMERRYE